MALPSGLETQVNAEVDSFVSGTTTPQANLVDADPYPALGNIPRFVQLPPTSAAPPGQNVTPDTSTTAPGRSVGWPAIKSEGWTPPGQLRCSIAVSEYQLPPRS